MYREITEYGNIGYDDVVTGGIVKHVVSSMDGRVILSTQKGRPLKLTGKTTADEAGFIETEYACGKLNITVYVIVRFGVSIQSVAAELMGGIRKDSPKILGLEPDRIKIIVTGVMSKNLSKRNVVVKSYADKAE